MTIELILKKRENKSFAKGERHHRAHIVVGWSYVIQYDFYEALCLLRSRIIVLNSIRGLKNTIHSGYHETLTQYWLKVLYTWKKQNNKHDINDIEDFFLEDISHSDTMYIYRSHGVLFSTQGRAVWVEPDVKVLEFNV